MEKRMRRAGVTFAVAALIIAVGFAVQGHLEARQYKRLLTNTYYHAFSELTTAVGELDTALQKSVYTTAGPLRSSLYQQVYAKALAAQSALGELPYGNVELERTAAFLARTGDYAAALCRGTEDGAEENLAALAAISADLNTALAGLQGDLEAGAVALSQVVQAEGELARRTARSGEAPGGAFQAVEADFPELPSLVYDGPFSQHLSAETPRALEGLGTVSEEQARQAAADFLHLTPQRLTPLGQSQGTLPTYGFSVEGEGGQGYVEVTCQGGQVLEYFLDRVPGQSAMDAGQGIELAKNYLANWGYAQMESSYHIQRDGSLTVHFAPVVEGVFCYPDLVKVTVGLDNGGLLSYEAHGYLSRHHHRSFPAPAVDEAQARQGVPQGLSILAVQKALIPTAGGTQEVLTYEFKCQAPDGGHVLIYVNAQTGLQQNILLLLEDETGTLTL